MSLSIHDGDMQVTGRLIPGSLHIPDGTLTSAGVQAAAGVEASKLQHQHQPCAVLADHATAAAAKRVTMHRCKGATGTIVSVHFVASVAPTGADTVTCTLKKNGSAILSASVVLDNANTDFVGEAGTLSDSALVAGDLVEAEITSVSGTTGKGVSCHAVIREDAQ